MTSTDSITAPTETPVPDTDGRRARGERTRIRVLDALLQLVDEGNMRPTAQEVAERASVALRTVYHHFEDVEALRAMALELQVARHDEILQPIDPALPLEERISRIARQRRKLFEVITPIRRATLFDEHSSPDMAEGLRRSRQKRRQHVATVFATELTASNDAKGELLDAVDVAVSWHTWNQLRDALGRSASTAERIMMFTLNRLLKNTRDGSLA